MYEVLADGMSPVHVLPLALVGVVLVEEVVFAVVENKAVRVVDPAPAGREVELRAVLFAVEAVLSGDPVRLIDFPESPRVAVVGDPHGLPFKSRHVPEHPVVRLFGGQPDRHRKGRFAFRFEGHAAPLLPVGDREVEVAFRDFQRDVLGLYARSAQGQQRAEYQSHFRLCFHGGSAVAG